MSWNYSQIKSTNTRCGIEGKSVCPPGWTASADKSTCKKGSEICTLWGPIDKSVNPEPCCYPCGEFDPSTPLTCPEGYIPQEDGSVCLNEKSKLGCVIWGNPNKSFPCCCTSPTNPNTPGTGCSDPNCSGPNGAKCCAPGKCPEGSVSYGKATDASSLCQFTKTGAFCSLWGDKAQSCCNEKLYRCGVYDITKNPPTKSVCPSGWKPQGDGSTCIKGKEVCTLWGPADGRHNNQPCCYPCGEFKPSTLKCPTGYTSIGGDGSICKSDQSEIQCVIYGNANKSEDPCCCTSETGKAEPSTGCTDPICSSDKGARCCAPGKCPDGWNTYGNPSQESSECQDPKSKSICSLWGNKSVSCCKPEPEPAPEPAPELEPEPACISGWYSQVQI